MNKKIKKIYEFDVTITDSDRNAFAELSGDWNPLHTDERYAASTEFKSCILHGAYSAGLISKMAGMIYPGENCLLHGMQLKFIKPIKTPITVRLLGEVIRDDGIFGEVRCRIENKLNGMLLVEGSYQFGRHSEDFNVAKEVLQVNYEQSVQSNSKIIVTGTTGALGSDLLTALQKKGVALKHQTLLDLDEIKILEYLGIHDGALSNIVHCGWPEPNNVKLTKLSNPHAAIQGQLTDPLLQIIKLAKLLKEYGAQNSSLILVGSSYSNPGAHGWSSPLYSISKGMLPNLVKILAQELSIVGKRVIGINIDVIDGGMNRTMSEMIKQMNVDRTLTGELPTMKEVSDQIVWIINNPSKLITGSFIDLSGGAQP